MKNIFLLLFPLFFISCKTTAQSSPLSSQQIGYMKDYFFCRCLDHAYKEDIAEKIRHNDISQSILFDIGNLGRYYKTLDSLAAKKAKSIQPVQISDYQNKKPVIMNCLEYRRELDITSLIR